MKTIEQTIIDLVQAKSDIEVSGLDQSLRGDLGLDSLDIVELIMAIEKEFDILISDEAWTEANPITVRDVVNAVAKFMGDGK